MPTIITRGSASARGYGFAGGSNAKGTLANPGTSALDIYNSGLTVSGWYYIKTSTMASAKQVYCNMTDNGGGWMLVAYNPTNNTTGTPLPWYWNAGEGSFPSSGAMLASLNDLWFHNSSPQCTRMMRMGNSASGNQIPLLANMTIANYAIYASGNFQFPITDPASTTLNTNPAISLTWYNLKGYTAMTGPIASNAPIDWVYNVGNGYYWTPCGPSNNIISSGRSGNGCGTGSWTNSTSADLYGLADVAATAPSNATMYTFAVYVR